MAPHPQYSCLENPMDAGAWWAAVHGVAKSWTRLSNFTFTFHFHALEKEMAAHSSVLAWRIPGTGEPGGLPSMGLHRVRHDWSNFGAASLWYQNQEIYHKKESYIPVSLMNTDAKTLNKILEVNNILCWPKSSFGPFLFYQKTHTPWSKWDLSQECNNLSIPVNQCDTLH